LTTPPAGWTSFGTTGNAVGGEIFNNNSTANPLTFTPTNSSGVGITTDTLDVWYYDGAGYSTITGLGGAAGASATVASNNVPVGSNTIKKATFTLAGTSVWKLNGSGAAGMIIFGISASTSAANNTSKQSEVTLLNVGRGGAVSSAINYNSQLWESLQTITGNGTPANSAMVSPLAIYSYGLNDLASSVVASTFYTNASTTITALKAVGTDVLLVVPPPVATGLTPYYSLYAGLVADYYRLANTFGLALVDLNARWTSNAVAQPLGYFTNTNDLHPSIMGYGDIAKAVAQFFKRL
jgi:lysophospholipase L1-like esterase